MYPYQNLSLEDMPGEVWKDIEGCNGFYQISSLGRIKSFYFGGTIRRQKVKKGRYLCITLLNYRGFIRKTVNIQRLVGRAFLENYDDSLEIDHIDGDPQNNTVSNLRCVTRKENINNPITKGRHKYLCGPDHPRAHAIYSIDKNGLREDFWGTKDAVNKGFDFRCIQHCLCGKQKLHRGRMWFYAN